MILYVHGKGGSADEAEHYRALFPGEDVVGLDYTAQTPWAAKEEFPRLYDSACKDRLPVTLIANSIGAYFAMTARSEQRIARAFFISPIVDMEKLITDRMTWANVSEPELRARGEIETAFGETLSWAYLSYVRAHPLRWTVPTHILYGENDPLTAQETVSRFASQIHATLTVMAGGEHWFHTEEQMQFLDDWIRKQDRRGTLGFVK